MLSPKQFCIMLPRPTAASIASLPMWPTKMVFVNSLMKVST